VGPDPVATVLGKPVPSPVHIAPTILQRQAHPDGERATAEAAAHRRDPPCCTALGTQARARSSSPPTPPVVGRKHQTGVSVWDGIPAGHVQANMDHAGLSGDALDKADHRVDR
jgi:isopentenyl diphosphate isomerase/L-lactate dehydrogenase-like FMN-dependent dehydrogenase